MIKKYCDRCEREIKGDTEYRVHLGAGSNGPGITAEAASFNISQNACAPRIYCEKCITDIQDFLTNKIEKTKLITFVNGKKKRVWVSDYPGNEPVCTLFEEGTPEDKKAKKEGKIGAIKFFKTKK